MSANFKGGVLTKEEYLSAEAKVMEEIVKKIAEETRRNRYDVGDVWITRSEKTPTENGFAGTWEQIKDTFILAAGDKYELGATGGEETHTLTEREMPSHSHAGVPLGNYITSAYRQDGDGDLSTGVKGHTSSTGGNMPHNNMPPYRVFNVWLRTA